MNQEELYRLMAEFDRSGLSELRWKQGESSIVLKKSTASAAAGTPAAAPFSKEAAPGPQLQEAEDVILVKAPLVGTFYAASGPGEPPFVTLGQRVEKGQTLCILEAMKMMSQVSAPESGVVSEICVSNGETVGYGTVLIRLKRD